jgi:hypothetical protein
MRLPGEKKIVSLRYVYTFCARWRNKRAYTELDMLTALQTKFMYIFFFIMVEIERSNILHVVPHKKKFICIFFLKEKGKNQKEKRNDKVFLFVISTESCTCCCYL